MKDLCREVGIPTAAYQRFPRCGLGEGVCRYAGTAVVVKADGLALGKGVIIAESKAETAKAIDFMFEGGFAPAAAKW